jgi:hypothetical protein
MHSVMLVFSAGFVNYCPSICNSLVSSPPLPCVNKYTVYTYTLCIGRGEWGHRRGEGLRQIKQLWQSPCTGQFF